MHLSTDIGGTFTDFVGLAFGKLTVFKLPSTPHNPSLAVKQGLSRVKADVLSHGTTVATNAVLERNGARCALVTTKGFRDILTIARQSRPSLYDFKKQRTRPYVERELCFEVDERVSHKGEIIRSLDMENLEELKRSLKQNNVESIAISLLFSFSNPKHERMIARELGDFSVSLSSEVLSEFREYERTSTTVMDAFVKPAVARYISEIEHTFQNTFYIMQSNGGVTTSNVARTKPVNILLSGPAGGVAAAMQLGEVASVKNLIAFDMGGTSCDISTICDSKPRWTSEGKIAGLPVGIPMLDITTIGAGGGSIAWQDQGGALRVGPRSQGADPGPVCYGKGGKKITVTDCNLLAGNLGKDGLLGGTMNLKIDKAMELMTGFSEGLGLEFKESIMGVLKVVNSNMQRAVGLSLARSGLDPRDFTLVAFGGAGPMHACALAREMGIRRVMIPFMPGAFSAYGILVSDIRSNYSKSILSPLEGSEVVIADTLGELREIAQKDLKDQDISEEKVQFLPSLDLRYKGQSYEINVELLEEVSTEFHKKHRVLYGYAMPDEPLELVNIRLFTIHPREKPLPEIDDSGTNRPRGIRTVLFEEGERKTSIFSRDDLSPRFKGVGPAIIEETTATTVIPPDVPFKVDGFGIIHMEVG